MLLARAVAVEPGEAAPALWSFGYFFCVLASHYLLRPVRDAMGAARGTEDLPWLFTGTFLVMVLAVPVFGALAARVPRRRLLPLVYAFFIACILVLFALLRGAAAPSWAPAAFFVWLSVFTIATQLFVTARLIARLGLPRTLPVLPALSLAGFAALLAAPIAAVLVTFQIARRATQYAIAGPARELLFTVVTREQKYKAKNFIDTVVYRGGDAVSGWAFAGLAGLGVGMTGVALIALPLTAVWVVVAVALGRSEERRRRGISVATVERDKL